MPGSIRVDTNTGENALFASLVGRFDSQTVRRQRLDVGDVLLSAHSGTVVVERKSWADLAKSLTDGRYLEQKTRMLSFVASAGHEAQHSSLLFLVPFVGEALGEVGPRLALDEHRARVGGQHDVADV